MCVLHSLMGRLLDGSLWMVCFKEADLPLWQSVLPAPEKLLRLTLQETVQETV
jgi:hypothetical protein